MSSNAGFSLAETLVAALCGVTLICCVGLLDERIVNQRQTADSNSAAIALAEQQIELLIHDPNQNPTAGQCPSANLCGSTAGLTHGPFTVDATGASALVGYNRRWVVTTQSLGLPGTFSYTTKQVVVTVTLSSNPRVSARLETQLN